MNDNMVYQIQVRGQVEAGDILLISPPGLAVEQIGVAKTLLTVCTDQSGLVGLIRHLHGLGLVLLSVVCCSEGVNGSN